MGDAATVAMAMRYPRPDSLERLRDAVATMGDGGAARAMQHFVGLIGARSLAEWEELHTATVDLSPKFVPYVGHAVWGENYRRGAFMADLARAMADAGIELHGELPDHLDPILRYIDEVVDPHPDVVEVLPVALMRMSKELRKSDKKNPYRHVLEAAQTVSEQLIDARRKAVT
jgi:nitrate reductase delta subunit